MCRGGIFIDSFIAMPRAPKRNKGFIGDSRDTYSELYPKIAEAIMRGEDVTIEYKTIKL